MERNTYSHFHRMTASFFSFPAVGFRARKRSRPSLIPFLFPQPLQMELKRVAEVATSLSMEFSRSPAAGANDPRGRNSLPVIFYDLTRALKAITCDTSFPQQRFRSAARGPGPAWHLNSHLGVDERQGACKVFVSSGGFFFSTLTAGNICIMLLEIDCNK